MSSSEYVIKKLYDEYHDYIVNARIDKVLKINDKSIAFILYKEGKTQTLLLSLKPTLPIFLLGNDVISFLEESHGFFAILKKYLEHSLIISFEKIEDDRIIIFHVKKRLPTYIYEETKLIFEMIPLRANLILLSMDNIIIDAFHKTEGLDNPHPLMKGMKYNYQNEIKREINIDDSLETIRFKVSKKEYNYLASLKEDEFKEYKQKMIYGDEYYITEDDISLLPIPQSIKVNKDDLLTTFLNLEKKYALENRFKDVSNLIEQKIKLLHKKILKMEEDIKDYENEGKYLEYGNLLYMGSDSYQKGDSKVVIEGITIPLKKEKDLIQNAQDYFKRYKKAKNGLIKLKEQLDKTHDTLIYFETLKTQTKFANSEDYQDILNQLSEDHYIKRKQKSKNKKEHKVFHPHFLTYENVKIGYGLSSYQNDYLTFTLAHKGHIFLHAKDVHGPHVIIFDENPSTSVLLFGAEMALYFASITSGDIYYTQRKNVKKIPSKIGMVELISYQTIHLNKIREESINIFKSTR